MQIRTILLAKDKKYFEQFVVFCFVVQSSPRENCPSLLQVSCCPVKIMRSVREKQNGGPVEECVWKSKPHK